ncbi:MAG: hypothetical protein ABI369_03510 [Acetobacteraceae bacterium]
MSGNGIDLAAIYQLLTHVAQTATRHDVRLESLERRMGDLERTTKEGIADVRQALTQYHASVMGHGILITELDVRLRRVEQHLKLPPAA